MAALSVLPFLEAQDLEENVTLGKTQLVLKSYWISEQRHGMC